MLVYRIALHKYAQSLRASGRAARWNPNDVEVIYTASSISLACLENVVHRNQLGLNQLFSVMTILVPGHIIPETIAPHSLPAHWTDFEQMPHTQSIGQSWIKAGLSAVLAVPSSIIGKEVNYLINPNHPDFATIKLVETEPFVFDGRIKG